MPTKNMLVKPQQVRPVEYPMASRKHLLQTNLNKFKAQQPKVNNKMNYLRGQTQQNHFQNVFTTLKKNQTKYEQFKIKQKQKSFKPNKNDMRAVQQSQFKETIQRATPQTQQKFGKEFSDQMQFIEKVQSFKSSVSNYGYQYHQKLVMESIRSRETIQSSQYQSTDNNCMHITRTTQHMDDFSQPQALQPSVQKPLHLGSKPRPNNSTLAVSKAPGPYDEMLANKANRLCLGTPEIILEESDTKIQTTNEFVSKQNKKQHQNSESNNSREYSSQSLDTDYNQERERDITLTISHKNNIMKSNNNSPTTLLQNVDPRMEIKRGRYQLPVILTKQHKKPQDNDNRVLHTLTDDNTPIKTQTLSISPQNIKFKKTVKDSKMRESFMHFRDLRISQDNQQNQITMHSQTQQNSPKKLNNTFSDSKQIESTYLPVPYSSPPQQSHSANSIQTKDRQDSIQSTQKIESKQGQNYSKFKINTNTKIILDLSSQKVNKRNAQNESTSIAQMSTQKMKQSLNFPNNDNTPIADFETWNVSSPKFSKKLHFYLSSNKNKEIGSMQRETTKKTIQVSNDSSPLNSHKFQTLTAQVSPANVDIYKTIQRSSILKVFDSDTVSQVHKKPDGINKVTIKNQPKQEGDIPIQNQEETLTLQSHHSPHFDLRITEKLDTKIKLYNQHRPLDSKVGFEIQNEQLSSYSPLKNLSPSISKFANTPSSMLQQNNLGRLYEGHKLKPTQSLIYNFDKKGQYKHKIHFNERSQHQQMMSKQYSARIQGYRNKLNASVQLQGEKIYPNGIDANIGDHKQNNLDIPLHLEQKLSRKDIQKQNNRGGKLTKSIDSNILENDRAFQICLAQFQESKRINTDVVRSPLSSASSRFPFLTPISETRMRKKRNKNVQSIDCADRLTRDLMIDTSQPLYQILQPKVTIDPIVKPKSKKQGLRGGVNGRDSKQIEQFLSFVITNQIK